MRKNFLMLLTVLVLGIVLPVYTVNASSYTVQAVTVVFYTNENTDIYADADLNTLLIADFASGLPVLVTGITSNGFFQVNINDTIFYIPGEGLSQTVANALPASEVTGSRPIITNFNEFYFDGEKLSIPMTGEQMLGTELFSDNSKEGYNGKVSSDDFAPFLGYTDKHPYCLGQIYFMSGGNVSSFNSRSATTVFFTLHDYYRDGYTGIPDIEFCYGIKLGDSKEKVFHTIKENLGISFEADGKSKRLFGNNNGELIYKCYDDYQAKLNKNQFINVKIEEESGTLYQFSITSK